MRLKALELIRLLTQSVMLEEALLERIVRAAADAAEAGDPEKARLYRGLGRQHRVRILELQGRLAALDGHYAQTYHPGL